MGGSAGAVINKAKKAVGDFYDEADDKISNYAGDLANDPGRVAVGLGTGGLSEMARETGIGIQQKIEEEAKRNVPKPGDLPPLPGSPGDKNPANPPDRPAIADEVKDKREARGRASTILTGPRGLGGAPTTARRTLLGA